MFGFSRKQAPYASKVRGAVGRDVAARLDANPAMQRVELAGAQIYYQLDFLSAERCEALIALVDANRRPSTLLSNKGGPDFRTSESCDMDRNSPAVKPTDEAVAALLGIDPAHAETMQGQRYAPGQQFKAHHDYFHEAESYWPAMKASGGQRTWTAMIYLNDVAEGGATWFPSAGIKVAPRRGMLLTWNNMKADGSPNELTIHEGMAVGEGVKYIITKWFRENRWSGAG
ncbi:prolyl 4-hydroxylase [Sphingomonas gellani]|uniref:Prolyl 4-hydroxylase n=1 Tax=Sphingomonas gellani TaxID=1166340 RepID=A0A1H8B4W2_9SPHN|nr:2OG-Fe(II) oxygenase [Sphingomonas gellani]SEM77951.1 prolyl 4-hydroxylase [Sphingomonas gellani]